MRWEKVAGALQRPKGTWLNSNSCPLLVQNAVFSLSCSDIGTCQYPLFRSRVENHLAPWRASRRSSILGKGWASLMVAALSWQKSTQNRRLPSFFLTITTGEAHGLFEGRMTRLDSICCTWAISSLRTAGFCRLYGWRRGGPWVSIPCSSRGVLPRSSSPWLKTSRNSLNNSLSCCCWSGERHSGSGGWQGLVGCSEEGEVVAGASARWTTSRTPILCPAWSWRGSGRWLCTAYQSSGPLESAVCRSQKPGEHRQGKKGRPQMAMGCDTSQDELSRE